MTFFYFVNFSLEDLKKSEEKYVKYIELLDENTEKYFLLGQNQELFSTITKFKIK